MKQFLNKKKHCYRILNITHSILLLTIFQLITFASVSQSDPELVLALEFNDDNIPAHETVFNISIPTSGEVTDYHVHNGYINFNELNPNGFIDFPVDLGNYPNGFNVASLNPQGNGYTIAIKIKTDTLSTANLEKQIFWIKDNSDRVIYGFKRLNNQLVFQRYVRDDYKYFKDSNTGVPIEGEIINIWDFDLWNPQQFNLNSSDYTIMIAVTENLFRVKVYDSSNGIPANANIFNYDVVTSVECNCELVYLGGQKLNISEISSVGFGSPVGGTLEAIDGIDYFRVYNQSIDFVTMDSLYNANIPSGAKIATKKLDVKDNIPEIKMGLEIYPNPINGEKELFAKFSLNQADKVTLQIFGLTGQLIRSESFNVDSGVNKLSININGISSGIYIIKTQGSQISESHKIIIE